MEVLKIERNFNSEWSPDASNINKSDGNFLAEIMEAEVFPYENDVDSVETFKILEVDCAKCNRFEENAVVETTKTSITKSEVLLESESFTSIAEKGSIKKINCNDMPYLYVIGSLIVCKLCHMCFTKLENNLYAHVNSPHHKNLQLQDMSSDYQIAFRNVPPCKKDNWKTFTFCLLCGNSKSRERWCQHKENPGHTYRSYFVESLEHFFCKECDITIFGSEESFLYHLKLKEQQDLLFSNNLASKHTIVSPLTIKEKNPSQFYSHDNSIFVDEHVDKFIPIKSMEDIDYLTKFGKLHLRCKACKVRFYDCIQMLHEHINGLMHREATRKKKISFLSKIPVCSSKNSARSSDFFCGICFEVIKSEELWNFHKFDVIHRNKMADLIESPLLFSCAYCGLVLYCTLDVLSHHINSKNNPDLQVAEHDLQIKGSNDQTSPRIVITGITKNIDLPILFNQFSKYGVITYLGYAVPMAVVEFEEWSSVVSACKEKEWIFEKICMKVEKYIPGKFINAKKFYKFEVHYSLKTALESAKNLNDFLTELVQQAKSLMIGKKSKTICENIESVLKDSYPDGKCHLFGSRLSGLSLENSDLDIFFDCGGMFDGSYGHDVLFQESIVKNVAFILKKNPDFLYVETVPRCRVPIVRFLYNKEGLHCDVAFKHGLGVCNTRLLAYLSSVDVRVKKLILMTKYLCLYHDLSTWGSGEQLSSYSASMLVVFYLQHISDPILPPIISLKESYQGEKMNIFGWDCSFSRSKHLLPKKRNTSDIIELLYGFFLFYSQFDFWNLIVCPLLGYPVPKVELNLGHGGVPQGMEQYIDNGKQILNSVPMCIQDPFELDYNITKNIKEMGLMRLRGLFTVYASALKLLLKAKE